MIHNLYANTSTIMNHNSKTNQIILNNEYGKQKNYFERNVKRKISKSTKSVSFNENIKIYYVENLKKYNTDVSYYTEYAKVKKYLMEIKKRQLLRRTKIQNECNCIIF